MKKALKIPLITLAGLVIGLGLMNVLGICTRYTSPTTANVPALPLDEQFWVSNLVEPERGDFIAFKYNSPQYGLNKHIFRMVAKGNDIIEIKDGLLWINKEPEDESRDLTQSYLLTKEDYLLVKSAIDPQSVPLGINYDIKYHETLPLPSSIALANGLENKRSIDDPNRVNDLIQTAFREPWGRHHFGPYTVPKNTVFVLGDNRNNALDSRYIGVIPVDDILGTVLNRQ